MGRINEKSIIQTNIECWLCGNKNIYMLERHEAFGGARRKLSIKDGLTVLLCGQSCHRNGLDAVHNDKNNRERLQRAAQRAWMQYNNGTIEDFREKYGKNYLEPD